MKKYIKVVDAEVSASLELRPVYQVRSAERCDPGWYDVYETAYTLLTAAGREGRILYTAPPATAASVPKGWSIEHTNCGYMVSPPGGPACWVSDTTWPHVPLADITLAKLCAVLISTPEPTHADDR